MGRTSLLHEGLLRLFERDPELLLDVLDAPDSRVLGDVSPAVSVPLIEADACVRVRRRDGREEIVLVEVQLRRDRDKLWAWPAYEAEIARRERAPAGVLIVTPSAALERWLHRELRARVGVFGSRFVPLVVGPSALRALRDRTERAHPGVSIFAALAAPRDVDAVPAAVRALAALPPEDCALYFQVLEERLMGAAREKLKEAMMLKDFVPTTPIAKRWHDGLVQARQEGREEGRQEGRERLAETLVAVLGARGLTLADCARERVRAADTPTLQRWIARAVTAASVEEALG